MNITSLDQAQFNNEKSLRSLVATVEFSLEILEKLPSSLTEITETKEKLSDALILCNRLALAQSLTSLI